MGFIKNGLTFREVEPGDLPGLRTLRNDPAMSSGWHSPVSVQTILIQDEWYRSLDAMNQAFIVVDGHETVGLLRLKLHDGGQAALTGTDVVADYQGRGYGKRILRSGAEHVLHDLGYHRVTAEAMDTNVAAQHIIMAAGFKLEGTFRDYVWRDGEWHSWHVYSLLQGEL